MLSTIGKELHLQYDEALGLLRVEWMGGRSMQHLRPALLAMQQLAKRLQVPKLLFDMDTMADLSVFDQIWLATTWLPTVMQLPLAQVVVVMGSKRVYNQQAMEVLFEEFRLFTKFDFQFFTQPLPGMQWLLAGAPCPPELLAEWQASFGSATAPSQNLAPPACLY